MKHIVFVVVALLMVASCKKEEKVDPTAFTITGNDWDRYNGDHFQIMVPDTSVVGFHIIANPIIKDGKFTAIGNIEFPQNALWAIYDTQGEFKYRKDEFIIEPGTYALNLKKDKDLVARASVDFEGGKYNTILSKNVQEHPSVVKALQDYVNHKATLTEKDTSGTANLKKSRKLYVDFLDAKKEVYTDLRNNHEDPMVKMLAIAKSDGRIDIEQEVLALQKQLGDLPEIMGLLESIKSRKEYEKQSGTIAIGKTIKDFTAKDLAGNEFHLANVLKENKYTLVEFWASWCGPCRQEIPHMKKAYSHFKDKGFEIVSFTLDHDMGRWEKASKDEAIPWINTGDMRAYKSPVVKMYGVRGVPANYLVDASGTIVDLNLRQEKLDNKLEELLGK
jgi:thiol-disulfide isomerase/thioredoxin